MKRTTRFAEKRSYLAREKKLDRILYRMALALMLLFVVHYAFIRVHTLGYHVYHTVFVLALPMLVGVVAYAWFRRRYIAITLKQMGQWYWRLFFVGFMLLQCMLVAFLSLGQAAQIVWNEAVRYSARHRPIEEITCTIESFNEARRSYKIYFWHQGHLEQLNVGRQTIKRLRTTPGPHQVILTVQPAVWNYYKVKSLRVH